LTHFVVLFHLVAVAYETTRGDIMKLMISVPKTVIVIVFVYATLSFFR